MNKRVLVFGLAIVLLLGSCNSVMLAKAQQSNKSNEVHAFALDDNTGVDETMYEESNQELIEIGATARKMRANKFLSMTKFYQSGQSWSSDRMLTCGATIGDSGCCLTSFTMIQNYFGGTLNPGQVNARLGSYACPFNYSGAASTFGYTIRNSVHQTVNDTTAIDFIIGAINSNYPVLVGLEKDSNSETHFVCAFGYNGTDVYIHDPASSRDYTHLNQYLADYHVHRLYVFMD